MWSFEVWTLWCTMGWGNYSCFMYGLRGRDNDSTKNPSIFISSTGSLQNLFQIPQISYFLTYLKLYFVRKQMFSKISSKNMVGYLLFEKNKSHYDITFFSPLLIPSFTFFFETFLSVLSVLSPPFSSQRHQRSSWFKT